MNSIDWGFTMAVVVVGLVVVFAVLLLLVLICDLMGKYFSTTGKSGGNKKETKNETSKQTKTPPATTNAVAVPQVQEGIGDDVVAAISAAIACIMGEGKKFAVRSISRSNGTRPVWSAAGIAENTRPF